jgi:hypothetical protein
MYSDILRRIAGIEVFPVFSLIVFVAVFTIAIVMTVRMDAARVARLSQLPLDETEPAGVEPAAGRLAARSEA